MQIQSLSIRNFKSIRELEILDVESSLILVGKNNTGKTAVLDAIRAVTGNYTVGAHDFNEKRQNIEIDMVLEITGEDLQQFHAQGLVSGYKKFDAWMQEVQELLPSFKENTLAFTCVINHSGKVRYDDGTNKHNPHIMEILPKLHFIDTTRNLASFQEDLLIFQKSKELSCLRSNKCMFDEAKNCNHCFSCIGMINKKKPEQLQLHETAKLLEYKIYQLNISEFTKKMNDKYRKNGGMEDILYSLNYDMDKMFSVEVETWNKELRQSKSVEHLSNGVKSIYMLSMLETYIEDENVMRSIIVGEYPELFFR